MTHYMLLDFSHEFSFGELANDIAPYNLTVQIEKLVGPGGGNPLLRLSGTFMDIRNYVEKSYLAAGGMEDEIDYYMEAIRTY